MHLLVHDGHSLAVAAGDDREFVLLEQEFCQFVVLRLADLRERNRGVRNSRKKDSRDDLGASSRGVHLFRLVLPKCTAGDLLRI